MSWRRATVLILLLGAALSVSVSGGLGQGDPQAAPGQLSRQQAEQLAKLGAKGAEQLVAGEFAEALRLAREVLALPMFPELTIEEQQWVVENVAEFYS